MYYYIADPPQSKADQQLLTTIRSRLVPEGIGGEFIFRTPGQSAHTLAAKAIAMGFTTLVCIGNEVLASEIAGALYDVPAALGLIPVHASPALHDLLGFRDWQTAIQVLRHRRLVLRDIGTINGERCFLTEITITLPSSSTYTIHTDLFTATATAASLVAKLAGDIAPFNIPGVINFCIAETTNSSWLYRLFQKNDYPTETILRSEQAVVQCREVAEVKHGGEIVAHTPVTLTVFPQAVRVIVARQGRATTG